MTGQWVAYCGHWDESDPEVRWQQVAPTWHSAAGYLAGHFDAEIEANKGVDGCPWCHGYFTDALEALKNATAYQPFRTDADGFDYWIEFVRGAEQ